MEIIKPFKIDCVHDWKHKLHLWEGLVFVDWFCSKPKCGGIFSESIGHSFMPKLRENYQELLKKLEKR